MYYAVIEKNYQIRNTAHNVRYIGSPCTTAEEARELVYAHCDWGDVIELARIDENENGFFYYETSTETGEITKEFFVRKV